MYRHLVVVSEVRVNESPVLLNGQQVVRQYICIYVYMYI